ncbi:MAG: NAD(P)-dependent oxidoreductase [Planctomycetota bacterium]|nr:NAD(P)-dependent oxidoreductase [Planctomycetota bacterium]
MNKPSHQLPPDHLRSDHLPSLGLIGIGLLGSALASRLLASGYRIHGYDTNQDQLGAFEKIGGLPCQSAKEVVGQCEILILSLPTSEVVRTLIEQLRETSVDGRMIIDTTTGDPSDMISFDSELRDRGARYVEATVAGSSSQLNQGEVSLFLGGESSTLDLLQPLFSAMSSKFFHLGPVGTASRFKLVHNLVLGLHRAVLAEGLSFAEELGFDQERTLSILKQSPAVSGVMETKGRRMVEGDYEPQARLSQHLKDVRLILSEVSQASMKAPLSVTHQDLLEHAVQLGYGDADNSAIIEVYRAPKRKVD